MGMLAGFIGPSYRSESLSVNAQRCVNWYLEQDPLGKAKNVFYGTPGLRLLTTIDDGPIRGAEACDDSLVVVSGAVVYRVRSDWSATSLMTLQTAAGPVFIAQAGSNALIVDGKAGYWVDWTGGSWTAGQVTADGFPASPATCTATDGYFITHTAGTQTFQISAPFDAKTWDAADSAAKEGQSDPLVRVVAAYRLLYLIGERTSEVWQDLGDQTGDTFPFVRIQGAFIEQGTPAAATVRDIDGAVLWLGQSKVGGGIVWRMQGFSPVRITTHAQEYAFSSYARIDDAIAWVYQDKGHAFYVLSFPTAQATWCFDITTQLWHERPYLNPTTGLEESHRGVCASYFAGDHVVGDRASGNLYALDRNVYTDNGDPQLALRSSPHVFKQGQRGYLSELEFFFEAGVGQSTGPAVDPACMLRVSKDGGRTFGYERRASLGKLGEYRNRARFTRLVNARDVVIQLSVTDPVRRVLIGANARIS